jgi:hypothetical protein
VLSSTDHCEPDITGIGATSPVTPPADLELRTEMLLRGAFFGPTATFSRS